MYEINQDKGTELLRWMLYAWDNQWLGRVGAVYGPQEAAKINGRVRSAFARTEMRALLALLGHKSASNLADASEMLQAYFKLAFGERGFKGQFRPLEAAPAGCARLIVEVERLTALDALKKAAGATSDNGSSGCEMLWTAWLETLLPEAQIEVTSRPGSFGDLYQIDSLNEEFSQAATSSTGEELSPIAAALQIPLDQISPPAQADPYGGGPASFRFTPTELPAPPFGTGLIGGSEGGAEANLKRREGLSARLTAANEPLPGPALPHPPPPTLPPTGPVVAPAALGLDPASGRPLFASDPEAEAREKVSRSKSKNMPLMSRMFLSKGAKDLMAQSAVQPQPQVMVTSIAGNVDLILQRRLAQARANQPGEYPEVVRVVGGPEGSLQILVGQRVYQSVGDLPPGPILDIIRQSVEEWSDSQG